MRDICHIEGVPYYRYLVRVKLSDGRRLRWVRWSPGAPWVQNEVARELDSRFQGAVQPLSASIRWAGL